ncbi:mannitol dehydrogenase family protein [Diaminobutyricibacter tongyongensis]|uniref:Mannitol-1-phosphate 5-dehydrogenase n=2 Tax=Leifsonia tongyongensis TaxID=1268043 RepID=A0A6L9Y190_9MICO|nr:mannitol dehydrogenase family protein [Diaminobutyricibacter tongyongensis]
MGADSPRTKRHPVRIVHLGLGAFHRAHQAWYTQLANDADTDEGWGIAAFTGRSPDAATVLAAQDDVYTLIERAGAGDSARLIESISVAADGADESLWRAAMADPAVAIVTLTITEAGYRAMGPASAGARLADGLRARRAAGSPPIAVVSCDNLPGNGEVVRDLVRGIASTDPGLVDWVDGNVSFVSTMVDRITPASTPRDQAIARTLTGFADAAPVVTEPFSEWVLSGAFPSGRPEWDVAGARFVDDIEPFERRKLWLLNAGHSALAYLGLLRECTTIAEAMADSVCRDALEAVWAEASPVLPFDAAELEVQFATLRSRFENARIEHRLVQIAQDGSQKLPPRILDAARARAEAGLPVGVAEARVVAAWIIHLTTDAVRDPGAQALVRMLDLRDVEASAHDAIALLEPEPSRVDAAFVAEVARQLVELRRLDDLTTPETRGAR